MKLTSILVLTGMAAVGALQGCSVAGPRASPLPKSGPKMIDIYERHVAENGTRGAASEAAPTRSWYHEPERTASATKALGGAAGVRFARLPNPDLEMYVYPHLAKGKYPVPGYTTVFPMFESVQYALPGEVAPPFRHAPTLDVPGASTIHVPQP